MDYPREFVLAALAGQTVADVYKSEAGRAGNRWRKAHDELQEAKGETKGPKDFSKKYKLPLCFFVKREFGIWIEALGGPEKRFRDLENWEAKARAEWDEEMRKEREAEGKLDDLVDRYLRTTSPLYQKRSEVAEAIRKIDIVAEAFYQEATDIRCDLIGVESPDKMEKIRMAGMERMRVLLPRAVEDLAPWEKYVSERANDGFVAFFSEWFTGLFDRLRSRQLRSETIADTESELDAILEIMRRMTNGTRNSDTDIEKWLAEKIDTTKDLVLKEAAES